MCPAAQEVPKSLDRPLEWARGWAFATLAATLCRGKAERSKGQGPGQIPTLPQHALLLTVSKSPFLNFYFLRWSFTLVAQAGVQWSNLGSLQPLLAGFK